MQMIYRMIYSYVLSVVVLCSGMLTAAAQTLAPETLFVGADQDFVDVMGNRMPALPDFPVLPKKPNKVRGYVKNAAGNPLQGAYVGVRSSGNPKNGPYIGMRVPQPGGISNLYEGAAGETDQNGYYEITIPRGAAHFYAASYTVDYGPDRVTLSLHPVDGETGSFASVTGEVENFVLLNYGIASRENPRNANGYYGGSVYLGYWTCDPCNEYTPNSIPADGELIVTLTPEGELLDGTHGQTFVIRKVAGSSSRGAFYINDVPLGRYRISVRSVDGKNFKIRQIVPAAGSSFEMQPRETNESASLLFFAPHGNNKTMGVPNTGSWRPVEIAVE